MPLRKDELHGGPAHAEGLDRSGIRGTTLLRHPSTGAALDADYAGLRPRLPGASGAFARGGSGVVFAAPAPGGLPATDPPLCDAVLRLLVSLIACLDKVKIGRTAVNSLERARLSQSPMYEPSLDRRALARPASILP